MKSSAKAFAPGNISCIFKIHEDKDPSKMGSYGLGFTINEGVTIEASLVGKDQVCPSASWLWLYFNNKKIIFPTVRNVVKKLNTDKIKLKINIFSKLPLSCGFGLSGASALATAYALNSLLNLKYTNLELAKIAHAAEVENKTGLGDVVNQYFGGFLIKLKPSSEFQAKKIPLENIPVYCKYFSKLSTKAVLSNLKMKKKINIAATTALSALFCHSERIRRSRRVEESLEAGASLQLAPKCCGADYKSAPALNNGLNFSDLISISKEFAQNSGLLTNKKAISTIKKIEEEGGHASMIMLGNAVFSDIPFEGGLKLEISNTPAHLL